MGTSPSPTHDSEIVECPDQKPDFYYELLMGTAGLSYHSDPSTTLQVSKAINSFSPQDEEHFFDDIVAQIVDIADQVNDDTPEDMDFSQAGEWYLILGFDIEDDAIARIGDDELDELVDLNEIPPEHVQREAIEDITLCSMWTYLPSNRARFYCRDADFLDHEYHFPFGSMFLGERGIRIEDLTAGGLAMFVSQELSRKVSLLSDVYENGTYPSTGQLTPIEQTYTDLFIDPLARAVVAHGGV